MALPLPNIRPTPATDAAFRERPRREASTLYDVVAWPVQALVSAAALVLLSPVFVLIAILIKLSGPGPVLYRGLRVGRGLRSFTIYKFRTMVPNTERQIGARLLRRDEQYRYCTPIGRFLKRTKLDELPQLVNVLRGEMRLVGPRPVRPVFLPSLLGGITGYARRFVVPPGITGIAQLRGGYYSAPRDKLRYDLIYIRNRSLLLDCRLVTFTFVKILQRWLSMGFFVLFLFLFASFVPVELQPVLRVPGLGLNVGLLTLLIAVVSAWVFLKTGPRHVSLYRSPINLPILLFLALMGCSTAFAPDPSLAVRGSLYYVITGLLTAFIIVNTLGTTAFVTCTVRVIALTSVIVSLLGFFEMFVVNQALGDEPVRTMPSASGPAALDSRVALAVYLVLGMPLLLAELTSARLRHRDFWLVCVTISFVGVFLTQSRVGLLALLMAGALFLYRRRRAGAFAFVTVFVLSVLLLVSLGVPRFTPPQVLQEMTRRIEGGAIMMDRSSLQWLIGSGPSATALVIAERGSSSRPSRPVPAPPVSNMHLMLIAEFGIVGWILVMWIVGATIVTLKQAYQRARDQRLKTLLWAIVSSLSGYVICMASMNTFHHLPIQVFFWSLIGIGLALATRVHPRRRHNIIWRFGDAGD